MELADREPKRWLTSAEEVRASGPLLLADSPWLGPPPRWQEVCTKYVNCIIELMQMPRCPDPQNYKMHTPEGVLMKPIWRRCMWNVLMVIIVFKNLTEYAAFCACLGYPSVQNLCCRFHIWKVFLQCGSSRGQWSSMSYWRVFRSYRIHICNTSDSCHSVRCTCNM